MSLQVIKSVEGKEEYVLLPISAYKILKKKIDQVLDQEFELFILEDYVDSPVALARMKANLTQDELAEKMNVSQAYISKLEKQKTVSAKTLEKIMKAIKKSK